MALQSLRLSVTLRLEYENLTRTRAINKTKMTIKDSVLLHIPSEELSRFCHRYPVRELVLFGSLLGQNHGPDSDVDLFVSFEPEARVTFLTFARMQRELETLLGHSVDLVPKDGLKPLIRDQVLATARVLYRREIPH